MHICPKRAPLQQLGNDIFKLTSYGATREQWAEWLRVPLEHAVARGNLDLVNTLLEAGANGSAGWRGCRGRTLLHAAAVGGNADVVTALLGAGAQPDVNVVSMSPKRSALYVALVCGHEEVARRLIQAGADVRFEDPVDQCSVLHEACCGSEQIVNDLFIAGADPNSVVGPDGCTPLHQAAGAGQCGNGSALLLRGVNKDALDRNGATPLMWAAGWGQVATVETLLAAGADADLRDHYHQAALDYAAINGRVPVVKAILGHGVDVNSRDTNGYSAIGKAATHNRSAAIDALVEAGADIEPKSNAQAPLMAAAYFSQCKAMLALLNRGAATAMIGDEHGDTPLHATCYSKSPGLEAAVDLLLRWGADETAASTFGNTPADLLNLAVPNTSERRCSVEEVERARLLLARAPADRAWRRRGWLVMLRSRASKVGSASHGTGGGCSNVTVDRRGECRKASRVEAAAGVHHDTHGQRSSSRGGVVGGLLGVGGGGGAEVNNVGLNGVVTLLLGLELEGVFRSAVSFL